MDKRLPLVAIVGPTAVGKTEIAIQLAERLNAEIVSADSRLLYRGMDIGTAKPSREQRSRVAHHLIDVADPNETWSLAVFQREAAKAIAAIHQRGRLPILVGGTGQYLRATLQGWSPPALAPQPELRVSLENWADEIGKEGLHARLALVDPVAASQIDARNLRRTLRALEVIFSTGRRFSDQRVRGDSPYRVLQLGLARPRPELYARLDQRLTDMLAAGWLDEVKALLAKGYDPSLPSMSAIGYAQLTKVAEGTLDLENAVTQIKRATRLFVRRQSNWFKPNDPAIEWFEANRPDLLSVLQARIVQFLTV